MFKEEQPVVGDLNPTVVLDQLHALDGTRKVRVTRTLVYEGEVRWLVATLGAPNAMTYGIGPSRMGPSISCTAEQLEILK